jgi:hypothetical protein
VANGNGDLEGYTEFIRATDDIKNHFPEAMRTAANEMASEWVSAAKAAASTNQEQIVAATLMVGSAGDGSQIQSDSPMFYGVEFGGQGRPETMQFPPFQGSRGYFFYPARRTNEERFMEIWGKGVDIAMNPWDRNG